MKALASLALIVGSLGGALGAAAAAPPAGPAPAARKPPGPGGTSSHAAAAATTPVTTVEGIAEYALGNGMHVLLFPDPSKETVTVNVTYLVGSRMEGYGETGMAHLLEHMMFKGSPRHPEVWSELEKRGAQNNASTWFDRTNYYEVLPATGDNLAWALEMEADRMINANIAQADLDKEFSVVRNEFEIDENEPGNILSERMWSTAYLWHNYGKTTIGSRADIEKVPATTLKRFYKKYYRPDNAVLVIAGKFDQAAALELVAARFAGLANPAAPLEQTYTTEPVQDGERVVTLRRNGDVQVVGLVYHVSAGGDPDFAAVRAVGEILTSEPSGRLYTGLVKAGLATSVSFEALALHDPGALELDATVPASQPIEAVRDKMIAIVEGLAKTKITDEEVTRVKVKAKRQFKQLFADSPEMVDSVRPEDLPPSYRVEPVNKDADSVESLANSFRDRAGVKNVILASKTIQLIQDLSSALTLGIFVVAAVLLGAAGMLILNTIRMAMFARRREIEVMKLVGATNWFIRVPFMLEGLVQGLLGALVAIISLAIFKPFFEGWLPKANEIPLVSGFTVSGASLFGIYALLGVVGALVGTIGAGVAVSRFLDV